SSSARRRPERRTPSCPPPPSGEPRADAAEVEPDEQDDEPLDDGGQVAGEVGPEDARVELPAGSADEQRAEEERREADAERRVASEQCCCEADEPDRARLDVVLADVVLPAGDVDGAGEAGERAR